MYGHFVQVVWSEVALETDFFKNTYVHMCVNYRNLKIMILTMNEVEIL